MDYIIVLYRRRWELGLMLVMLQICKVVQDLEGWCL